MFRCVFFRVKFFPQVQFSKSNFAPSVNFGGTTDHLIVSSDNPIDVAEISNGDNPMKHTQKVCDEVTDIANLRKKLDWKFWSALSSKDWEEWERVAHMYSLHSLPMDEVSWTLLIHGYLMSHRHNSANAALVLSSANHMHPAIRLLNESLVNSFFQLSDMGVKASLNGWQNVAKLAWMSAARLRKKRAGRAQVLLNQLSPQQLAKVSESDVARIMLEDRLDHHTNGKITAD